MGTMNRSEAGDDEELEGGGLYSLELLLEDEE